MEFIPLSYNQISIKDYKQWLETGSWPFFNIMNNAYVRPEVLAKLQSEKINILHMEPAKPWDVASSEYEELFLPYAKAVGLELPKKPIVGNIKKACKTLIKMVLPYGVVRLMQKARGKK